MEKIIPSEYEEHMVVIHYCVMNNLVFYHIPNGGYRTIKEAVKLKKMGVCPGVPDICIPMPNKKYHSLYIELKRTKKTAVTKFQKEWIKKLNELGNKAVVCYGADEAIKEIDLYFLER